MFCVESACLVKVIINVTIRVVFIIFDMVVSERNIPVSSFGFTFSHEPYLWFPVNFCIMFLLHLSASFETLTKIFFSSLNMREPTVSKSNDSSSAVLLKLL